MRSAPRRARASKALRTFALAAALAAAIAGACGPSVARALPPGRAYELVSPADTNGASPGSAIPSTDGEAVDFEAEPFGEAATGGLTLYQSRRGARGWQTRALTPKDVVQPGLIAQTAELFVTPDLTQTLFTTEQPLVAADRDGGALDLYEASPQGALSWVTQGTQGGTGGGSATFAGATPDGRHVVFDSPEPLLAGVPQLEELAISGPQFLYERDLAAGTTSLLDVDNAGTVLDPGAGAVLGNGNLLVGGGPPAHQYLPAGYYGSTTHAISNDGSKVFFESPAPAIYEWRLGGGGREVHLYMRKDGAVTVPIDDPHAEGGSGTRYVGASEDGSKVFFVSDEALAGSEFTDDELYVYDTIAGTLAQVSAAPRGAPAVDGSLYGAPTAISNDGSHVYYVARGALAANENAYGQSAVEGQPNLYVYDTAAATNTFVARLDARDVEAPAGGLGRLVTYLDVEHPAVPTPDGRVLVFLSRGALTGQAPAGITEIYRYDAVEHSLLCISCGPTSADGATIAINAAGPGGAIGGGSYDPPGQSAPMSVDGQRVFFETADALLPEDQNSDAPPILVSLGGFTFPVPDDEDVYEWHDGHLALISAGLPGLTSLQAVTPSGHDVFFDSSVNLTGVTTTGAVALYDARAGGGFPPEPPVVGGSSCADAASCRPPSAGAPALIAPGSAIPAPDTNVPALGGAAAKPKAKPKAKSKPKPKHKPKRRPKVTHKPTASRKRHPHGGSSR